MTAATELAGFDPSADLREPVRWRSVRTFLRKKLAVVALTYLIIFYAAGIFAPVVAPYDPRAQEVTIDARGAGPSSDHLLGQDLLGRDLLSRILFAARTTILFTLAVLLTGGVFLGLGLGLLSGYRGGWIDTAVMRVGEVLSGLPTLILMLAITASFRTQINDLAFNIADSSWLSVEDSRAFVKFVIIVGATVPFAWVGSARIVRSQALAIREQSYVEAAEAMGAGTWRILVRHILPGVMPLFLVGLSSGMASIALAEVSLSYLGLGIDEPASSFGTLLNNITGPQGLRQYPHMLLAPAIPLILFFFSWNLLGDALVDVLESRRARG